MSETLDPPGAPTVARLRALAERELSAEEFAAALTVPISSQERAAVLELIEWFGRRYPTPAERLAYVRRAYRRWTRAIPSRPASP